MFWSGESLSSTLGACWFYCTFERPELPFGTVATFGKHAVGSSSPGASWLITAGMFVALAIVPIAFVPNFYDDFTLIKQAGLVVSAAMIAGGVIVDGAVLPESRALRVAFLAWIVALVISEALAIDRRGSVLGLYQYRQGLATQLCYLLIFLGGVHFSSRNSSVLLWAFAVIGTLGVTTYTVVQSLGVDPVHWWIDTSDRAIGTIGNANELAAFAVIAMVACAARGPAGHRATWLYAGLSGCCGFVVLESESRAGLAAFILFLGLLPFAWVMARNSWGSLKRPAAALALGMLLAIGSSFAAGGLTGTTSRIEAGVQESSVGGSTRLALWRGTLNVIRSSPLHGAGPDGLYRAFPIRRPADLEGAFQSYDLVVQSSHNAALDIAADYGLPALGAYSALISLAAWSSVRRVRNRADRAEPSSEPFVWCGLAAYGAVTLLNPISLAPQAMFFAALGAMTAADKAAPWRPWAQFAPVPIRGLAAGLVICGGFGFACLLSLADLRANAAWDAYATNRFDSAAQSYRKASSLMPFERRYKAEIPQSLLAAGVSGGAPYLTDADHAFEQLEEDFGFTAGDALGQAAARIGLQEDSEAVAPLIDEALRLNPHGVSMADYTGKLRRASVVGGTLHYSDSDHWVYVEPNTGTNPP